MPTAATNDESWVGEIIRFGEEKELHVMAPIMPTVVAGLLLRQFGGEAISFVFWLARQGLPLRRMLS
ncbi:unnamed protein product [Penicillium glandicola]